MKLLYKTTLVLFALSTSFLSAQEKLNLEIESAVSISDKTIPPLWMHSNEWGKYLNKAGTYGLLYLGGDYQLMKKKNFSLKLGAGGVLNTNIKTSFLHEAYLKGHFWFVDYSIGKEADSWVAYDESLSTGNFIISSNVRPIPKMTLGIKDYLPLGFTKNWLEIKGGMSQGVLNDERGERSNSANNVLLHEKWAYARLGNSKLQPYGGIVHSALFGGTRPDGTKIPIDFFATFFATGSTKLGGGEETNAAGAHMGIWDFGLYYKHEKFDAQFYLQKPFADASGLKLWRGENKDYTIGFLIYPKEISCLKGISLEFIKTDVQSDYGIPDPLYPVDYNGHKQGSIIWKRDIENDYDNFMFEVFGETSTGWSWPEVNRYMEVAMNEGYKFGGRDDYMNNGTYYSGWSYHGESMGIPLYHTYEATRQFDDGPLNHHLKFINNRVNAFHLGMEGDISKQVSYRLKTTYSVNKGSYAEEFTRRYSWDRVANFYYKKEKQQVYSLFQAIWKIKTVPGLELNGTLAYDFGDLYHSFGGRLGIVYRPHLN